MGKLGQWLLVGANLGILVGLILMVLQIRQSYDDDSDRLAIEDVIAQYAYRCRLINRPIFCARGKLLISHSRTESNQ